MRPIDAPVLAAARRAHRPLAPTLALLLLAALLALAGCGGSSTTAPSTSTLLKNAQTAFDADTSFHFLMTVTHLGQVPVGGYNITTAEGDVQRPSSMKTNATADAGFAAANVTLIIVGDKEWITDPITGKYVATSSYGSFLNIFDAQQGIGSLLTRIQNPSTPADGDANGVACWKISGTLAAADIGTLFGQLQTNKPIPVTVCIGKSDNQLDSAALTGLIVGGDTAQTVRTFYLSNFNKSVSIATPAPGQ
jgi:hypothetical protein